MSIINRTLDFLKRIVNDPEITAEDELIKKILSHIDGRDFIYIPIENNKLKLVHINEIHYVHKFKKEIVIKTEDEEIIYLNPSCDIFEYLEGYENKFRYMGTRLLGNITNITGYDTFFNRVYFSDEISIEVTGTFIVRVVKPLLGTSADKNVKMVFPRREYAHKDVRRPI